MFYDVDILNPRGGKFGIIWLAAHKKLRLKSRTHFQLMLKVNISQTCQEIQRYIQAPSQAAGMESPRLSLYLAAMLTHGAILIHHKKVRHDVAQIETIFRNKAAEQDAQKKISIIMKERTSKGQTVNPNAMPVEMDFGNLAFVDFEVAPSPRHQIVREEAATAGLPMDVIRSAEMIADDFADLEALFSQGMTLSHLTTTDRITMKEVEPLPRAQEFEGAEGFGDEMMPLIPPEDGYFLEPLLETGADISDILPDGYLRTTPSKRGLASPYSTPSKRRPRDDGGAPAAVSTPMANVAQWPSPIAAPAEAMELEQPVVDPNPVPLNLEMVLEPLEQPVLRQGRRRRRRRLMIDQHIFIGNEDFIRQKDEYIDTQRVRYHVEDHIRIQPEGYTAEYLMKNPGRKIAGGSFRDLITRNMIVKPVAASPVHIPDALPDRVDNEVAMGGISPPPLPIDVQEVLPPNAVSHPSPPNAGNEAAVDGIAPLDLPEVDAPSIMQLDVPHHETVNPDQEELRLISGQSRDPSFAMSVCGASRIDVTNDGSRLGAQPTSEQLPLLAILPEASMEGSRNTVENHYPLPSAMSPPIQPIRRASPFRGEMPEGPQLIRMIQDAFEENGGYRLTFLEFCPPTRFLKRQAAKMFENLLFLCREKLITMDQDVPYGPIYISML